nr:RodZ family helix-turn-helix domain-containing protein [uncultured Pseudomonas sp.]
MKAAPPEVAVAHRVNPGESLRKARESKGWTIAEVSAQLNLTPQRLGQIEVGAFDKLPGHTFARGYIRAYAKLLDMDQNRLVLEFDQFTGSDAAGASVHSLGHIEEPARYSQSILRFVSFLLLVALAGAGFYWWQEQSAQQSEPQATSGIGRVEVEGADGATQVHVLDEPEDQAVIDAQAETELDLSGIAAQSADQQNEAAPVESTPATPGAEEPANPAESAPSAADQAGSAAAVVEEPAPAPLSVASGEAVVALQFSADCWVQLRDSNGKILFGGLKRKGDSLQLAGKPPLELRLGYARGAQVSYNGAAVDVNPYISGETARITLGGQ